MKPRPCSAPGVRRRAVPARTKEIAAGPLVTFDPVGRAWVLAGVVSFGEGCAAAGVPSVFYMEVAGLLPFIEEYTGPLDADPPGVPGESLTEKLYLPSVTRD